MVRASCLNSWLLMRPRTQTHYWGRHFASSHSPSFFVFKNNCFFLHFLLHHCSGPTWKPHKPQASCLLCLPLCSHFRGQPTAQKPCDSHCPAPEPNNYFYPENGYTGDNKAARDCENDPYKEPGRDIRKYESRDGDIGYIFMSQGIVEVLSTDELATETK